MSLKLRVDLGFNIKRNITWYKNLLDFPKIISHDSKNWEWVFYDTDPGGHVDHILTFGELKSYNNMYGVMPESLDSLSSTVYSETCQCGSVYDRHFPDKHSDWCPKWRKV